MGPDVSGGTHASLARFLRRERDAILDRWERAIRRLAVARTLDRRSLLDHLPDILDRVTLMVEDAEMGRPVRTPGTGADLHAIVRLDEGYELQDVVREYAILRECILDLRAEQAEGALGTPVLNEAIDQAIAASVARYEKARERTLVGLDRISAAALRSPDLDHLLRAMLALLLDTTEAVDSVAIYLLEGGRLHLRAAVGTEERLAGRVSTEVGGRTAAGVIAATRRPLELHDAAEDPRATPALRESGARAFYGVPMLEGDELRGVAYITSTTAAEFSNEDKLLFRVMVERATTGLSRYHLQEELRRREAELEAERQRLRGVLDVLPVGVIVAEADGRIVLVNPAAERIWGGAQLVNGIPQYGAYEAYRRGTGTRVAPSEWGLARALTQGEVERDAELDIVAADGTRRVILNSAAPIRVGGRIVGAVAVNVDITDRRATELERQRAREQAESALAQLDALFVSSPIGLALFDRELRYVRVNESLAKMNGIPAAEHEGRTIRELLPQVADMTEPILRHVVQTGMPVFGVEAAAEPPNDPGHLHQFLLNYHPVRTPKGALLGVGGAVVDITRQREVELQLRASETELRLIIDAIRDHAIYMLDPDGTIATWSSGAERIKGYGAEEIIGQPYEVLFRDAERANREPEHILRIAREQGVYRGRGVRRRKDGTELVVEASVWPLYLPNGELRGYVKVARDVTREARDERRRALLERVTEVLTSSFDDRAALRAAVELTIPELADTVAIDLLRDDGLLDRIAFVSRDPARAEDARRLEGTHSAAGRPGSVVRQTFEAGRPRLIAEVTPDMVRSWTAGSGLEDVAERFHFHSAMVLPLTARGKALGVLTFLTDVSGRRYDADDLVFATELARRAALAVDNALLYQSAQNAIRARDEFLSIASHDLRNPLASLRLQVQTIERHADRSENGTLDTDWVRPRLANMERQIDRITALLNDILEVSRIHAGRLSIALEDVDLTALVEDVAGRLEEVFAKAGCELTIDAPEPVQGRWDALRLEQVVTNLLSNAAKYGAGRPVRVMVRGDADTAELVVRDEGVGIAPEHQEQIFQRFERAGDASAFQGVGLGLWIVKKIVTALGGDIRVESSLGRGATFRVTLPRTPRVQENG